MELAFYFGSNQSSLLAKFLAIFFATNAIHDLPAIADGQVKTHAWGVNSDDVIVGDSATGTGAVVHAVKWVRSRSLFRRFLFDSPTVFDLGALPALPYTEAKAINARGLIVGNAWGALPRLA